MKKIIFLILVFVFIFSVLPAIAQEEEGEIPPGMEMVEVGGVKVLAIKGAKVRKKDGLLVLEGTGEYVARKFIEVEKRFDELEGKIERLEKEIEGLTTNSGEED